MADSVSSIQEACREAVVCATCLQHLNGAVRVIHTRLKIYRLNWLVVWIRLNAIFWRLLHSHIFDTWGSSHSPMHRSYSVRLMPCSSSIVHCPPVIQYSFRLNCSTTS